MVEGNHVDAVASTTVWSRYGTTPGCDWALCTRAGRVANGRIPVPTRRNPSGAGCYLDF